MPTMILLAAIRVAGSGPSSPSIDLHVETIEARSISELVDGEVIEAWEVTVPSGESFEHRYTDPRTGHEHRALVALASPGESSARGELVAARLRIESLATGDVVLQNANLAIDGRMYLALHPVPGTDHQVFLSLEPRLRRGD